MQEIKVGSFSFRPAPFKLSTECSAVFSALHPLVATLRALCCRSRGPSTNRKGDRTFFFCKSDLHVGRSTHASVHCAGPKNLHLPGPFLLKATLHTWLATRKTTCALSCVPKFLLSPLFFPFPPGPSFVVNQDLVGTSFNDRQSWVEG